MLEALERPDTERNVYRYANVSHLAQFAASKNLSVDDIADVIAFDHENVLHDLISAPFRRKVVLEARYGNVSRYSTGEWPVFYGALTAETAKMEVLYHYNRSADPIAGTYPTLSYTIVRCTFRGTATDLLPKLEEWPDLVSDDYSFCNSLGLEAHQTELGGFLAPSARHVGGTTVPAFVAETLSGPQVGEVVQFASDPSGPVAESRSRSLD